MRVLWLDNLKAIGIFLVIVGHFLPESLFKQYVYSFHVPLFFFVSGYLFDRHKHTFAQFVSRKFHTLIGPYLFFALLSFLFWFLVVRNLSIEGESLKMDPAKPLLGILYSIGVGPWRAPMSVALWFLTCLFVAETLFYFVRSRYVLILFALLAYLATYLPFRLPWSADIALAGAVFYGVGHFYKDRWITLKALPFLLLLHLGFCFLNGRVDMNHREYGNMLYFYIAGLSGVLAYATIGKLIGSSMILQYLGKNTIILIGLIGIVGFVLNGCMFLAFHRRIQMDDIPSAIALAVVEIAAAVPAIYIINRWFPFVLDWRKFTPQRGRDELGDSGVKN